MMNFEEMKKNGCGFGWNVNSCDGHNISLYLIKVFKKSSKKQTYGNNSRKQLKVGGCQFYGKKQ